MKLSAVMLSTMLLLGCTNIAFAQTDEATTPSDTPAPVEAPAVDTPAQPPATQDKTGKKKKAAKQKTSKSSKKHLWNKKKNKSTN